MLCSYATKRLHQPEAIIIRSIIVFCNLIDQSQDSSPIITMHAPGNKQTRQMKKVLQNTSRGLWVLISSASQTVNLLTRVLNASWQISEKMFVGDFTRSFYWIQMHSKSVQTSAESFIQFAMSLLTLTNLATHLLRMTAQRGCVKPPVEQFYQSFLTCCSAFAPSPSQTWTTHNKREWRAAYRIKSSIRELSYSCTARHWSQTSARQSVVPLRTALLSVRGQALEPLWQSCSSPEAPIKSCAAMGHTALMSTNRAHCTDEYRLL